MFVLKTLLKELPRFHAFHFIYINYIWASISCGSLSIPSRKYGYETVPWHRTVLPEKSQQPVIAIVWFRNTRPVWVSLYMYPYSMMAYGSHCNILNYRKGESLPLTRDFSNFTTFFNYPLINYILLPFGYSTNTLIYYVFINRI